MFLALLQKGNAVVGDQVREIILVIVVVMFHFLTIEVESIVVKP